MDVHANVDGISTDTNPSLGISRTTAARWRPARDSTSPSPTCTTACGCGSSWTGRTRAWWSRRRGAMIDRSSHSARALYASVM